MRLTSLENKFIAQGLINKEQALASKPNDNLLRQNVMLKIAQNQITPRHNTFDDESIQDELLDYYDFEESGEEDGLIERPV